MHWQVGGSSGHDSPVTSWLGVLRSLGNRAQVQSTAEHGHLSAMDVCSSFKHAQLLLWCCGGGLPDSTLGCRFWVQFRWWQANEISNLAGTISYIFALILWATSFEWVR